jgi:hypothetical protein
MNPFIGSSTLVLAVYFRGSNVSATFMPSCDEAGTDIFDLHDPGKARAT